MYHVMPVMNSRYACYDSCYACYVLLLWPLCNLPRMLLSDFTSDFLFYDYYPIHVHILFYHSYFTSLVSYSYLIIPWVLPTWYHLLCIYLLLHTMPTTRFSMHDYDSVLSIHLYLSQHAIWHLHHHSLGEFWLLWILMSRSWSLDRRGPSCWGSSLLLWSRQISCSSSPILAPPWWLAASPAISWAPFCIVYICTSLCILAFAPISDVIFL